MEDEEKDGDGEAGEESNGRGQQGHSGDRVVEESREVVEEGDGIQHGQQEHADQSEEGGSFETHACSIGGDARACSAKCTMADEAVG
jgi:hypothetical protein